MGRISIARSLRLALIGLAIALASVAAASIASLYNARQRYENVLARSSDLGTAVANLTSAGVVQVQILHDATGPLAAAARAQAARAFMRSAKAATDLAATDPTSARLVARQIALQKIAAEQALRGRLKSAGAGGATLASAANVADDAPGASARPPDRCLGPRPQPVSRRDHHRHRRRRAGIGRRPHPHRRAGAVDAPPARRAGGRQRRARLGPLGAPGAPGRAAGAARAGRRVQRDGRRPVFWRSIASRTSAAGWR